MTQEPKRELAQYHAALKELIAATAEFEEAVNAGDALFVALARHRLEAAAQAFTYSQLKLKTPNEQNNG